jgi:lysine 6-dehydrogenase
MRIAVFGGAGLMGSGTVRDLVSKQSSGVEAVVVADVNEAKARRLVQELGDARLEAVPLDVRDKPACLGLLEKVDICINAVPTFAGFQMDIFHVCLEARRHYLDYGGMGVYTVKQKAEAEAWERAGITAILGNGADPGMSNVLCKAAAEGLDQIEKINLYWAAKVIGPENPVLVPPYSITTLLGEYANPSKQFIDGGLVEMPPQSGQEVLTLPEPFGETLFMHTQHSEPLTVPFARGIKDKGIREFTWKLHLPDAEHEVYKALVKVGFGDFSTPVKIRGVEIMPGEFLETLIARNIEQNKERIPKQKGYEIHLAIGRGAREGRCTKVTCMVLVGPDPFFEGYNDAATSMNTSIGAQLLGRTTNVPGVWGPEEYYDTREYFAELKKRHFNVTRLVEVEEQL